MYLFLNQWKEQCKELNLDEIVRDLKLRKPIEKFHVAIRDQVQMEYCTIGPCQLVGDICPKLKYGNI